MIIHGMLLLSFFEVWCACTPHLQPSKKAVAWKGTAFTQRGMHADRRLRRRRWVGVVLSLLKIPVLFLSSLFFLGNKISSFPGDGFQHPARKLKSRNFSERPAPKNSG